MRRAVYMMLHKSRSDSYIVYVVTFSIFLSGYGDTAYQTAIWVMLLLMFYANWQMKLLIVSLTKSNV